MIKGTARELILNAAEQLFAEQGVNAVSLRAINAAAGVSPGVLQAPAENRIFKLDLKRQVKVAEVSIPGEPHGMVLSPDGNLLFIVQRKLDQVAMMDTSSNKILATRKVGKRLDFITTSPDGKFVFVTSRGEDKMYKLAVGDLGVKGAVATGKQPHGIAWRP